MKSVRSDCPQIRRLPSTDPCIREDIVRPFSESRTANRFAFAPKYVVLGLAHGTDTDGGLIAQIYWNWMHIEVIAVPECLRGQGFGRKLVAEAEAIAGEAGCAGAWVDTYSFHVPGFYVALGYRPFGTLCDYPAGESRIFYAKRFDEESAERESGQG